MVKNSKTNNFIKKAIKIHENEYDYSSSIYIRNDKKIKIICLEHGEFEQTPNSHLNGRGCKKCGINSRISKISDTLENFIKKSQNLHTDKKINQPKYLYHNVIYKNNETKVIINCPIHGNFLQTPHSHLAKKGCAKCSGNKKLNTKDFIVKSQNLHKNENNNIKYNYSESVYINYNRKIIIFCPKHGKFEQTPHSHLQGNGCPSCIESKGEKNIKKFLIAKDIFFIKQKTFPNCVNPETNFKLKFDFYLPNLNMCLEYDGIQHSEACDIFGGYDGLKKLKFKDEIKNEYCKINNIKLLRISYTEFNNIEHILEKELKKLLECH